MEKLIQWIEDEIQRRDMSIREFARLCDMSPGQISNVLNGRQGPGLEFVKKLAIGTNTDINVIISLIFPEHTAVRPETALLADRINKLTPEDRRTVEAFVLGLALKRLQETKQREDVSTTETLEEE